MTGALEDIAGAKFERTIDDSGPHRKEILTTKGPISERITVEVTRYYSYYAHVCTSISITMLHNFTNTNC